MCSEGLNETTLGFQKLEVNCLLERRRVKRFVECCQDWFMGQIVDESRE